MMRKLPFLISIPHGGTSVPEVIRPLLALTDDELRYHCDPDTRRIFRYTDRVEAFIDTQVSRMIVDLNRPPLPLPPKDPDGIIKLMTVDGKNVYRPGCLPDITLIHQLLRTHYFPYHQSIDELIDKNDVRMAFDCHSMLPVGSPGQKDAGRPRPLICLGNNGDPAGNPLPGGITTCTAEWLSTLARTFEEEFRIPGMVALNDPFPGGFIVNSHFWHKGIPWIQIEVNRSLYESDGAPESHNRRERIGIPELSERIWQVLDTFWQETG
jgi:N-formylglutamate deformylase